MLDRDLTEKLFQRALSVLERSYSKYSNFKVASLIGLRNGEIICGVNIENKAFGETICAEKTALVKLYSDGLSSKDIEFMFILSSDSN
jgi:cytidine deaminase